MAIRNVARNVKGHGEACGEQPHDHKTGEANFIQILRIEKEVWDAQILTKVSGDHGKKNNPAQHEHMVAPDVVQQELNRKGVK